MLFTGFGVDRQLFEAGKHRLHLTLVNPAVVRALQGRKTDQFDAFRRIAECLQYVCVRTRFHSTRSRSGNSAN